MLLVNLRVAPTTSKLAARQFLTAHYAIVNILQNCSGTVNFYKNCIIALHFDVSVRPSVTFVDCGKTAELVSPTGVLHYYYYITIFVTL